MKSEEKGLRKGFKHLLKAIRNKRVCYIASCASCVYESKEGCSNQQVISFDIIDDGERMYCSFWKCSWED